MEDRRYALTQSDRVWTITYEDGNVEEFAKKLYRVSTDRDRPKVLCLGPRRTELAWTNETGLSATSRADLISKMDVLQQDVAAAEVDDLEEVQLGLVKVRVNLADGQFEIASADGVSSYTIKGSTSWRQTTGGNVVYKDQMVTPAWTTLWIDSSIFFFFAGAREHFIGFIDGKYYDIYCVIGPGYNNCVIRITRE